MKELYKNEWFYLIITLLALLALWFLGAPSYSYYFAALLYLVPAAIFCTIKQLKRKREQK